MFRRSSTGCVLIGSSCQRPTGWSGLPVPAELWPAVHAAGLEDVEPARALAAAVLADLVPQHADEHFTSVFLKLTGGSGLQEIDEIV